MFKFKLEEMLKRINISMFGKRLNIEKIDIEQSHKITKDYNITSVPTIIVADKRLAVDIQEEEIIDAILYGFISSVKI